MSCPRCMETVVFGVPDEAMGEELAMVLYLSPGEALDEDEVRALPEQQAGQLQSAAPYSSSGSSPLPQNASGKLHKLKTREMFLGGDGG